MPTDDSNTAVAATIGPIADIAVGSPSRRPSMRRRLRAALAANSLYGNSAWLFLNTALLAAFGFVFWSISARVFTTAQVGVATGLIAAVNLITSLALGGLEISLIRFLPASSRKQDLVNASLTWTAGLAMVCGTGFIALQPLIAHRLGVVGRSPLIGVLFVVFCAVATASYIVESVLIAHRSSRDVLLKNAFSSLLKLPLPFVLVFAGAFGIFSAWMVSLCAAVLLALWLLNRRFRHRLALKGRFPATPGLLAFSLSNYLATLAEGLPDVVLPLIVLGLLGAVAAAHYYIAVMLASLLFAVSAAAGQALFAEGSYSPAQLIKHTRKALVFILLLLVPGILATVVIGPLVLGFFGAGYRSSASGLLTILAVSAVLVAANDALRAIHKVRLENVVMFAASAVGSAVAIALCFPLSAYKLPGIGLAWFCGQLTTLFILAFPLVVSLRRVSGENT